MNVKEKCKRIWEGYKLYASTAYVSRKGFELVGMTELTDDRVPMNADEIFRRRGESGLEHQAKTAWLSVAFNENFPHYFADRWSSSNYSWFTTYSSAYLAIVVALNHDIGEVSTGDIPDNGNPLHDTKDAIEHEVFEKMVSNVCNRNKDEIMAVFDEFQDKNSLIGKAIYALDKIEAVLNLLFLEQYNHYGAMGIGPFVTEQDKRYMRMTHSSNATDCWAAHVKELLLDYPRNIMEPVFSLLQVAVEDVRGEMFEWWDQDPLGKV